MLNHHESPPRWSTSVAANGRSRGCLSGCRRISLGICWTPFRLFCQGIENFGECAKIWTELKMSVKHLRKWCCYIYTYMCVFFGWNDHWWTLERLPTLAPLRWFLYPFQESFGHAWFLSQIQHSNLENDDISYLTWFLSIINHPPVITILWVL